MQCSTMDCILDQKRNITGKPGETLTESGVQLMVTCQCKSFSFDNYTIIMLSVSIRKLVKEYAGVQLYYKPKIIPK